MLIIDGKKVDQASPWWDVLNSYDRIVTIHGLTRGAPRRIVGGINVPIKLNIGIPMRFSIQDPNKGGVMVSVIYSPNDDVPFETNGTVPVTYHPQRFKITQVTEKLRKEENAELLIALALHPYNQNNFLYAGTKKTSSSSPCFRIDKRGAVAQESNDKDVLLIKALGLLVGEGKMSDTKIISMYKYYGLDPDALENAEDLKTVAPLTAALKEIAKNDPAKFIEAASDGMYDMKARIADAFSIGILVNSDSRKITWGENVEGRTTKTILQYGIDGDKVQAFAEYLVKKDTTGEVRDKLLEELEKASVVS